MGGASSLAAAFFFFRWPFLLEPPPAAAVWLVTCQQRYRWHLEKNATQMAAISWRFTSLLIISTPMAMRLGLIPLQEGE